MKICILGAGVVGLTTAWQLSLQGHDVTIIDRNRTAGAETSARNGAQLSYAFVAPLASPETLKKLLPALLAKDSAIRIRPPFDLDYILWGLKFIAACSANHARTTTAELLSLSALSRLEMARIAAIMNADFGLRTAGKIVLHRNRTELENARRSIEFFERAGTPQHFLSANECRSLEPALRWPGEDLLGGVVTPSEQVADCGKFCASLAEFLRHHTNVRLLFGTTIGAPVLSGRTLVAVRTSQGEVSADLFVLCLATDSTRFAHDCGLRLPIYPMKGYSITLKAADGAARLAHSITDFSRKVVYAPLASDNLHTIRVAGMADFVGYDRGIDTARIESLKRSASEIFDVDTTGEVQPWAGLRPATPDGRPLIGWCPVENLLLNTGHGGLGWTLACGSARLAAALVATNERAPLSSYRPLARQLMVVTA